MKMAVALALVVLLVPTTGQAQNVFVTPSDSKKEEAAPPAAQATPPQQPVAPVLRAPQRTQPPVRPTVTGQNPDQQMRKNMAALAAQDPNFTVNGFTIADDIRTLLAAQNDMAKKIGSTCQSEMFSVMTMQDTFFKVPGAAKNFTKVGKPFLISLADGLCRDTQTRAAMKDTIFSMMIRNSPGSKVPTFSVQGGILNFADDFSKPEPPAVFPIVTQLRRFIDDARKEQVKQMQQIPNQSAPSMRR